jgi:hypothetical protein
MRSILAAFLIATAFVLSAAAQDIAVPLRMPQIELSPDGTVLAVYESAVIVDNEVTLENLPIRLYDAASGAEIGVLEGAQNDLTNDVAFSPDGTRLASIHSNGELIVWDVTGQTVVQLYDWLPIGSSRVDFLPDGSRLSLIFAGGQLSSQAIFDLNLGAIVDILQARPETFRDFRDVSGNIEVTGRYGIGAQAVGIDDELYGATPNGEVFVWDMSARTRVTLYPEVEDMPMRFNVRNLKVLDDGTLLFYDEVKEITVRIAPDGTQTEYPFGGAPFAMKDDGTLAYIQREPEYALYVVDITDDSPEPVLIDTGEIELRGMPQLEFLPDGRLLIGSLYTGEDSSAIHRIELSPAG